MKARGFYFSSSNNCFKGEFNGKDVDVFIHTNHCIVDRVYVAFPPTSESNIIYEYNLLLSQFNANDKYADLSMNSEIPEDEDISYEIGVNNKRYQSTFCYFSPDRDPIEFIITILEKCAHFLTAEQLEYIKNAVKISMEMPEEERNAYVEQITNEIQSNIANGLTDPEKALNFIYSFYAAGRSLADGEVWFMIHENHGLYQIGLYYDNVHNQAHGEDL